ncbi:MAG: ATP-dependent zinc metalloprotease FtsH [Pseudomonadales bacterium]|nr:ATP-dependent zinc metalloprotease FtsH [Pseudomonadales bacterium]
MAASEDNSQKEATKRAIRFTLFFLLIYTAIQYFEQSTPELLNYSEFKNRVVAGQIKEVTIQNETISGELSSGDKNSRYKVVIPSIGDTDLMPLLDDKQVTINAKSSELPLLVRGLLGILPWILIIGLFMYSSRLMQKRIGGASGGGMFGFSRSKARRHEGQTISVGYEDVAGLEQAKADLLEIVDYLKHPQKYLDLGAKIPKGILMMGSPGTGKTLLAKATAGEAGVPFYSISGSEFIEMFVGVGASRVRDMFEQARKDAPAIIFIDEIDSVGRVRGTGLGGGNDEREQTLNQILAEMDGFEPGEAVVVLAATNRPDVLDPALLRPGRFDRKLTLELPQCAAREKILEVHTRKVPLKDKNCLKDIASRTVGFSGADLENLVNEAALHAASNNSNQVVAEDFEYARDKVILGSVRDDLLTDEERKRVAYHEAGHALTALHMKHSDRLRKVSIIPRGRALGVTEQMPDEDRHNFTQDYLEERISILLGGRCAERKTFGVVSSGASDDLKQATQLARRMVAQWGMNDAMGPVSFPQSEDHPFLGREMSEPRNFSEQTLTQIDREVTGLLSRCETITEEIIEKYQADLDKLANALVERETLDEEEINRLLDYAGSIVQP